MDSTVSVSKGCFLFKNGFNKSKTKKKSSPVPVFEQLFDEELWYKTFQEMWDRIESQINELNATLYSKVLYDIVSYVKDCYNNPTSIYYDEVIPCATLLTGINQPDHIIQFSALKDQIMSEVTPHVAVIYSQDASSIKQVIENMVLQFATCASKYSDSEDMLDSPKKGGKEYKIKKSHCNMTTLMSWYNELYGNEKATVNNSPLKKVKSQNCGKQMVVIIPDFESFNIEVLQNFIMILSGYTPHLPFVIIFGVATAVSALHKSFPYDVSSRLYVQVFQSHTSMVYLNQILEHIFLSEKYPFHLSGKTFKLLIDVFLFYDFSVIGFIQNLKYCMMEHYYRSNINSLCAPKEMIPKIIAQFHSSDLEAVRHLPSFRPFVESKDAKTRISLLTNNEYLTIELTNALQNSHLYMENFHIALKVLLAAVGALPNAPLGKQIRELYAICTSSDVSDTPEYKQCLTLLSFQSKEEILDIINRCVDILKIYVEQLLPNTPKKRVSLALKKVQLENSKRNIQMSSVKDRLSWFKDGIYKASLERSAVLEEMDPLDVNEKINRKNLKEILMKVSGKEKKGLSEFESLRNDFLNFFTENIVQVFLKPPHTQAFHEIFFFSDIYKVKRHIVGSPRASIHTALNNPVSYLQCSCCKLPNSDIIIPTLPDLSIAYKLHLECGRLINLYDWLQAFLTIVDPVDAGDHDEERREINPEIQARFTRAVSELQFLGFIKTSKRKTDHVSRLTW